MEWYHRFFEAFSTYATPFLLAWICYRWASRAPRTRWSVFWALFTGALAVWGLTHLVLLLLEASP
jgi:uncharacterized BrkB/YihY/UPF0761 family membrane protein